jgi:hypothetical protein
MDIFDSNEQELFSRAKTPEVWGTKEKSFVVRPFFSGTVQ